MRRCLLHHGVFKRLRIVLGAALLVGTGGCRGEPSGDEPLWPLRNMFDQQRYDPQQKSLFFPDERVMRMPVAHTVAREESLDTELARGLTADKTGYVLTIPDEAVARLGGSQQAVERGQDRYAIYCVPCHDAAGTGKGLVIQRGKPGFPDPPSFHDERVRHMPDGQLFATISNGVRTMPAYRAQIPMIDRWAIVTYVRALQVNQAGTGE